MNTIKIEVDSDKNERLDYYIALNIDHLSRSHVKKLIDKGLVFVNAESTKSSYKVNKGDMVEIKIPKKKKIPILAEDIPLDIIYEDDDLAVVNKPQDMVVYPATGNVHGTLVNSLLFNISNLSTVDEARPGIVHRLDKDTSGLLVVAKNNISHKRLTSSFKNRQVMRIYKALVHGSLKTDNATIEKPIGRHPVNRTRMAVTKKNSRKAITHYKVVDRYEDFTLLELRLESGRTHQIRVHMSYINHPVVGDPVYSTRKDRFGLEKQMLHAYKIGFNHPRSGKYMEFTKDVPAYFQDILNKLENERKW